MYPELCLNSPVNTWNAILQHLDQSCVNNIFLTMILATIETWLTQPMPVPLDVISTHELLYPPLISG